MAESTCQYEILRKICAAVLCETASPEDVPASFAVNALALAERHRVVPLLAAGAPAGLRESLRRRQLALAQQTVRLEHELAGIARLWADAGIEYLVLKGPALARQAYAKPEWRCYDDVDLWVESVDLPEAIRVLNQAGYRRTQELKDSAAACAQRAGIEVALRHPERGRLIEVSHGWCALAPCESAASAMKEAGISLRIAGAAVRVLAPVHSLLFVCAHGAHHRWDRLSWVADVAGLWRRMTPEEQEQVVACARAWRVESALGIGLRLAAEQLGVELSGTGAEWATSPRVRALVERVQLEKIGPDTLRVSMIERLQFERDVQDSSWRRWQTVARWIFQPTLGDLEAVPLPALGFPLYGLIRPVRLLLHPWRGEWRSLIWRG